MPSHALGDCLHGRTRLATEAEYSERRARLLDPVSDLGDGELKREIRESLEKLSSALESLSPAQATWKPNEDEWSTAQICDHIALGTGTLGNIVSLLAAGSVPGDADWDPAPQFKGDVSDLRDVRQRLKVLSSYTDELFDQAIASNRLDVIANNSFLGDLNWRQWYAFLKVHAVSHVEQIEKLRATPGFPG